MNFLLNVLFCIIVQVSCLKDVHNTSKNDNSPFWINPCGYNTNNNDYDDSDCSIIDRILTLAKQCQNNIDTFKTNYIKSTFNTDYFVHYETWEQENNSWITHRLLKKAEDDLPQLWLDSRLFPEELKFTHETLQRVSVGFELLLQDAKLNDSSENKFVDNFWCCKNDLQQILCEINDDMDIKSQEKPIDISRDVISKDIRQEKSTSKRSLTNSIIFRDYLIAIKYITNTYNYFKKKMCFITDNDLIILKKNFFNFY